MPARAHAWTRGSPCRRYGPRSRRRPASTPASRRAADVSSAASATTRGQSAARGPRSRARPPGAPASGGQGDPRPRGACAARCSAVSRPTKPEAPNSTTSRSRSRSPVSRHAVTLARGRRSHAPRVTPGGPQGRPDGDPEPGARVPPGAGGVVAVVAHGDVAEAPTAVPALARRTAGLQQPQPGTPRCDEAGDERGPQRSDGARCPPITWSAPSTRTRYPARGRRPRPRPEPRAREPRRGVRERPPPPARRVRGTWELTPPPVAPRPFRRPRCPPSRRRGRAGSSRRRPGRAAGGRGSRACAAPSWTPSPLPLSPAATVTVTPRAAASASASSKADRGLLGPGVLRAAQLMLTAAGVGSAWTASDNASGNPGRCSARSRRRVPPPGASAPATSRSSITSPSAPSADPGSSRRRRPRPR